MKRSWALALILASTTVYGDTLYRSVAEDGTVTYSDRPQSNSAEAMDVHVPRAQPPQTPPVAEEATQTTAPIPPAPAGPDEPTIEELRAQKAQACTDAQYQLAHVQSTDQLYRQTSASGMVPLSGEEIAEVRARAQAEVDEWCG